MKELPEELLVEIIDYLSGTEILPMFLVSKSINGIISNSVKLMEKFKLSINFNNILEIRYTRSAKRAKLMDPYCLLSSNRKYQIIEIVNIGSPPNESMLKIFRNFQHIKILVVEKCQFAGFSFLQRMLDIWKTSLCGVRFNNVSCSEAVGDAFSQPIEFGLSLKKLQLTHTTPRLLKIFTKSVLEGFCLLSMKSEDPDIVIDFLNTQENLKKLLLEDYSNIFLKTDLSSVKFQLDVFHAYSIIKDKADEPIIRNFQSFLKNQGKSLKIMNIRHNRSENFYKVVLNMPLLESLIILSYSRSKTTENNFSWFPSNSTIEHLQIQLQRMTLVNCTTDESMLTGDMGKFTNLQELELISVSWELTKHLLTKNPQLAVLKIDTNLEQKVRDFLSENLSTWKNLSIATIS